MSRPFTAVGWSTARWLSSHLEQVAIRIDEVHAARAAELVVDPGVVRILGAVPERDPACAKPRHDLCEAAGVDPERNMGGKDVDRRYCFGGAVVLEMARVHPELACVVAFHPGLTTLSERDDRKIRAKVMVCAGVLDPLIPAASRERFISLMNAAEADWQLLTYSQAGHSFTDRTVDAFGMPNFFYHAPTDRRSWAAMRDLFDEAMGRV